MYLYTFGGPRARGKDHRAYYSSQPRIKIVRKIDFLISKLTAMPVPFRKNKQ